MWFHTRDLELEQKVQRRPVFGSVTGTRSAPEELAKPLLILQREHETVLAETRRILSAIKGLGQMEGGLKRLAPEAVIDIEPLMQLLLAHQAREERVLLPIVEKYLDSDASGTIRSEHMHIQAALKKAEAELVSFKRKESKTSEIEQAFRELHLIIETHFSREENVLFWFASLNLSESESDEMAANLLR